MFRIALILTLLVTPTAWCLETSVRLFEPFEMRLTQYGYDDRVDALNEVSRSKGFSECGIQSVVGHVVGADVQGQLLAPLDEFCNPMFAIDLRKAYLVLLQEIDGKRWIKKTIEVVVWDEDGVLVKNEPWVSRAFGSAKTVDCVDFEDLPWSGVKSEISDEECLLIPDSLFVEED